MNTSALQHIPFRLATISKLNPKPENSPLPTHTMINSSDVSYSNRGSWRTRQEQPFMNYMHAAIAFALPSPSLGNFTNAPGTQPNKQLAPFSPPLPPPFFSLSHYHCRLQGPQPHHKVRDFYVHIRYLDAWRGRCRVPEKPHLRHTRSGTAAADFPFRWLDVNVYLRKRGERFLGV